MRPDFLSLVVQNEFASIRTGTAISLIHRSSGLSLDAEEAFDEAVRVADHCLRGRGFAPIGDSWRFLSKESLQFLVRDMLAFSLAYSVPLLDDIHQAVKLAERFAATFARDSLFLTNGDWGPRAQTPTPVSGRWYPATRSTFDVAVFGLDRNVGILLLVEEED